MKLSFWVFYFIFIRKLYHILYIIYSICYSPTRLDRKADFHSQIDSSWNFGSSRVFLVVKLHILHRYHTHLITNSLWNPAKIFRNIMKIIFSTSDHSYQFWFGHILVGYMKPETKLIGTGFYAEWSLTSVINKLVNKKY